jgi:hypothetical protein
MSLLRGKKLFAGRLFAGRLFGPTPDAAPVQGGGGWPRKKARQVDAPTVKRQTRLREDDVLLFLLR